MLGFLTFFKWKYYNTDIYKKFKQKTLAFKNILSRMFLKTLIQKLHVYAFSVENHSNGYESERYCFNFELFIYYDKEIIWTTILKSGVYH